MKTLDVLLAVDRLLDSPAKWTKGDWAKNAEGRGVFYATDPEAVCYCLGGAIHAVAPIGNPDSLTNADTHVAFRYMDNFIRNYYRDLYPSNDYFPDIVFWNDRPDTEFEHVKYMLSIAIDKLRAEAGTL